MHRVASSRPVLSGKYVLGEGMAGEKMLVCKNMPRRNVDLVLEGYVKPAFKNHFGDNAGDHGGRVDWWLILRYQRSLHAAHEMTPASRSWPNIRSHEFKISETIPLGEANGTVRATLEVYQVQIWPNDHGPLEFEKNFTATLRGGPP